jgi:hypothetical protein
MVVGEDLVRGNDVKVAKGNRKIRTSVTASFFFYHWKTGCAWVIKVPE